MTPRWPCPMTPEEVKLERKASCRRYRQKNRDRLIEYDRQRRLKQDKFEVSMKYREYYQANKERIKERNRVYREKRKAGMLKLRA